MGQKKEIIEDKLDFDVEEDNSDLDNEDEDLYWHIANQLINLARTSVRKSDDQNIDIEDSIETEAPSKVTLKRKASSNQVKTVPYTLFVLYVGTLLTVMFLKKAGTF